MSGFMFQTTRSILSEIGSVRKTGALLKALNCKSVMVVTDMGLVRAGIFDQVKSSLETEGIRCTVFNKVLADPAHGIVRQAVEEAKREGVDGIVGLGGGSPMDVAKLVAFLTGNTSQSLDDIYGLDKCKGQRLPLIQVPTTAGTGSEVTPIAIITTGENQKSGNPNPNAV